MGLNVKQKVKHFTNKNRSMSKVMQRFLRLDTKAKFIKKPIDELYFVKVKKNQKLLLCKIPCEKDEKTSYTAGENICTPHSQQRPSVSNA